LNNYYIADHNVFYRDSLHMVCQRESSVDIYNHMSVIFNGILSQWIYI